MKRFLSILRLPEQTVSLVPFLFGALDSNLRDHQILPILGLGLFLLSVSFFVINEYVDWFDTDQENLRKEKAFDLERHKKLTLLVYALLTALGITPFIIYRQFFPLVVILFFGNFYSLPPFRFKARFPWDMIAPVIAWGLIPYSLSFSLQGLPYERIVSVASISALLLGIPMQGIHYLADAQADAKAGIQNFCTVMGYKNFLRLIDKIAIFGLLGFIYLVYRHERWWYYPMILASIYEILVIGYARAAIYFPTLERLHSITSRSYNKGIIVFILILVFQIWALSR